MSQSVELHTREISRVQCESTIAALQFSIYLEGAADLADG